MNYEFVMQEGVRGIRCLTCGKTSYHATDIAQRYCAHCRRFHDEATIYVRALVDGRWQPVPLSSLPDNERKQYLADLRRDQ